VANRWLVIGVIAFIAIVWSRPVFATKTGALLSTKPEIDHARRIVANIWRSFGYTVTVTSGYDGTHQAQSLHYDGLAEDYRTRDVTPTDLTVMVSLVRQQLGSLYDVVVKPDHLHVEYDPT
jgi:hypothetical protein